MAKKFEIEKSDAEWRQQLTADQYDVLRRHGTEPPGSSLLDKQYNPGVYKCAGCGTPLFSSEHKFDSRSGWPSYFQPLEGAIGTSTDFKLFMPRTEVHCAKCGGHLGHVFDDGPAPTGKRYCINGVSLKFDKE
ncbi:MAG: peptide-methionine (R)-S-oxide reductase MsrB [Rhodospirillales bacterium]|nr:peptide-methionine (R)-S-oxide reductase MsrB [Rhodospirillales bacterium]